MDPSVIVNIVLVLLFVLIGGVFAGTEMAIVNLRESQISQLEETGPRGEATARLLHQHGARVVGAQPSTDPQEGDALDGTVGEGGGGLALQEADLTVEEPEALEALADQVEVRPEAGDAVVGHAGQRLAVGRGAEPVDHPDRPIVHPVGIGPGPEEDGSATATGPGVRCT